MPARQGRFNWMAGLGIGVTLVLAALSFAATWGSNAKAIESLDQRVATIEGAKVGERLGRIEGTLELIVRGLGLRPVP